MTDVLDEREADQREERKRSLLLFAQEPNPTDQWSKEKRNNRMIAIEVV